MVMEVWVVATVSTIDHPLCRKHKASPQMYMKRKGRPIVSIDALYFVVLVWLL